MSRLQVEWVRRIEAGAEQLADEIGASDVRQAAAVLSRFVQGIEPPADAMHATVLASVLMHLCSRVVRTVHEQNPPVSCVCEAGIWSHIGRCDRWRDDDPREAFEDWVRTFFSGLEQQHPRDAALHAAEAIRDNPARPWPLQSLADAAGVPPVQLRREFEQRFSMRPASYLQLARVVRAIPLLRTGATVDAVAADVGYRSKKDLYAALGRWLDMTPTALRALPEPDAARLVRQLRVQCVCGAGAHRGPALSAAAVIAGAKPGASTAPAFRR